MTARYGLYTRKQSLQENDMDRKFAHQCFLLHIQSASPLKRRNLPKDSSMTPRKDLAKNLQSYDFFLKAWSGIMPRSAN